MSNFRCVILHTLVEEAEQVAMGNQVLYVTLQPLGQSGEEVQCYNHELLIRDREMLWVSHGHLCLVERLGNERDTALKDRLTVRKKTGLKSCGHR